MKSTERLLEIRSKSTAENSKTCLSEYSCPVCQLDSEKNECNVYIKEVGKKTFSFDF